MRSTTVVVLCCLIPYFLTGCDRSASSNRSPSPVSRGSHDHGDHDHGDHDHDHDHDGDAGHSHAPAGELVHSKVNGGHVISFPDAPFSAEWLSRSQNDTVTVCILNREETAEQAVVAESVSIRQLSGTDPESWTLPAANRGEDGTASRFELTDRKLKTALTLGVAVEVVVDGQTWKAEIPPHKPHDH